MKSILVKYSEFSRSLAFMCYRWKAVHVSLHDVPVALRPLRRVDPSHTKTHRRQALPLQGVRAQLRPLRSFGPAHETPRAQEQVTLPCAGSVERSQARWSHRTQHMKRHDPRIRDIVRKTLWRMLWGDGDAVRTKRVLFAQRAGRPWATGLVSQLTSRARHCTVHVQCNGWFQEVKEKGGGGNRMRKRLGRHWDRRFCGEEAAKDSTDDWAIPVASLFDWPVHCFSLAARAEVGMWSVIWKQYISNTCTCEHAVMPLWRHRLPNVHF